MSESFETAPYFDVVCARIPGAVVTDRRVVSLYASSDVLRDLFMQAAGELSVPAESDDALKRLCRYVVSQSVGRPIGRALNAQQADVSPRFREGVKDSADRLSEEFDPDRHDILFQVFEVEAQLSGADPTPSRLLVERDIGP
jgi:hypothetical protein